MWPRAICEQGSFVESASCARGALSASDRRVSAVWRVHIIAKHCLRTLSAEEIWEKRAWVQHTIWTAKNSTSQTRCDSMEVKKSRENRKKNVTYRGFLAVGVDGLDRDLVNLEIAAVSQWRQLQNSMKWNPQIRQFLWKQRSALAENSFSFNLIRLSMTNIIISLPVTRSSFHSLVK